LSLSGGIPSLYTLPVCPRHFSSSNFIHVTLSAPRNVSRVSLLVVATNREENFGVEPKIN
jgi:hypothetical protein